MRLTLVNLCMSEVKQMPPMGLMYISAAIKMKLNINVILCDLIVDLENYTTINQNASEIACNTPDVVCITTYTTHHVYLAKLINKLQQILDINTVYILGGPHATLAPESCMRTLNVDFVVTGPGEDLILSILEIIMDKGTSKCSASSKRPRMLASSKSKKSMCIPEYLPDRECLNLTDYANPFTLITARGCPGKCMYCASPALNNGRCYYRSIQSISDEIEHLAKNHCAKKVAILDDTFTHDLERLRNICSCLSKTGINWFCESRMDSIDNYKLELMVESGCVEMQFGVECFDQSLMNKIGKRINTSTIPHVLKTACELGIHVAVSLMIGLPDDSVSTVKARINKALQLGDIGVRVIEFSTLCPFPGTAIYREAERFGYETFTNWWELERPYPLCFPSTTMTREELVAMLMYAGYKIHSQSSAVSEVRIRTLKASEK